MRLVKKSAHGLALAAALVLYAVTASASPFDAVFGFGDSLMDGGNVAIAIDLGLIPGVDPGTRQPLPLPPDDLVPSAPYAVPGSPPALTDNFSAGPAWVTLLAEDLGLSSPPSNLFLGNPSGIGNGANFAFGGARSGPEGSFPLDSPSFLDQVNFFQGFGITPSPSALFVVGIGGNNVRDAISASDPAAAIATYGDDVFDGLNDLVMDGARNLLIANIPDVGNAPDVVANGASAAATSLTELFNAELLDAVGDVVAFAGVDLNVWIFDQFTISQELFDDPGAFGISNVSDACAADPDCFDDPAVAAQYAFWDGIHPSAAVQRLTADAALDAIPEPGTALLYAVGLALLGVHRRRMLRSQSAR